MDTRTPKDQMETGISKNNMPPKVLTNEQIQQMKGGSATGPAKVLTSQQMQQALQQKKTPPKTPTSLGQKVLNAGTAVTNFLGGKAVADTFGAEIARAKAPTQMEKNIISGGAPSVRETTGSAIQLGANFLPIGTAAGAATKIGLNAGLKPTIAKLAGNAAAGAGTGYAFDVGANLQEGKKGPEAFKPGMGTALGAAIPTAISGIGGAKRATTNVASSQAPRLINSLIKPLAKDFAYGKNPGRTVSELGIVGNDLDDLAANIRGTTEKLHDEATTLGRRIEDKAVVYLGDALKPLDEAIKKAAANNNSTVIQRIQEVKDAITKNLVLGKDGEIVSSGSKPWFQTGNAKYNDGLEAKRQIGKLTKFTGNPSDDKEVNSALKKTYGFFKEALDKAAMKADPATALRLRKLNEQQADLISAEVATTYRDKIQQRQNLIGISPTVFGLGTGLLTAIATGGAAVPAILAGMTGAALDKALSSPGVKTRVAAWLAKLGRAERERLLQDVPKLKAIFPGDLFLETASGKAALEYGKNLQPGLSMKNVSLGKKPQDLNIPTLKSLNLIEKEVKTPTVSKQYLLDLANRGELKQPERDLLRKFIGEEGDVVDVKNFAEKVKSELLPLKRMDEVGAKEIGRARYENVNLPDELRGPVANYNEHIYESPIQTSAGGVHFSGDDYPNYFAHTRIEDLPVDSLSGKVRVADAGTGKSVDFRSQQRHFNSPRQGTNEETLPQIRRVIEIQSDLFQKGRLETTERVSSDKGVSKMLARDEELKKLEPYRNTWWERVVREEVKQAAKDGKTKLQFPTGETAMKIEGLGSTNNWVLPGRGALLNPSALKTGMEIANAGEHGRWIITDVLGEGKFKAVPKDVFNGAEEGVYAGRPVDEYVRQNAETFDISGKVDTNNPIYKFYEKDVQKYLTKKYGGKVVTDPQGVKWIEIEVPKEAGRLPVEAFGLGAIPTALAGSQLSEKPEPLRKK